MIEVVFHGAFAAAGDDDDVLDARCDRLFDAVLDDGLVDQRQHLFGDDLGGGQKTRAQAAGGENNFANFCVSLRSVKLFALLSKRMLTADLFIESTRLTLVLPIGDYRRLQRRRIVAQHRLANDLDGREALAAGIHRETSAAKMRSLLSSSGLRGAS